jgi:hypothetical protein
LDDDDGGGGGGGGNDDDSICNLFPCLLSSQGRFQSGNTKQQQEQIKQKGKQLNQLRVFKFKRQFKKYLSLYRIH